MRTDQGQSVRLADYRPPDHLVDEVRLDVALHPTATRVRATLALRPNPHGRAGAPLILDGDELVVTALSIDGQALDLASGVARPDGLRIEAPPARPFTLEIETKLDPSANTQLMGLYRSGSAYCTQCEAEGFRRITYYLDRPDVLSIFTTRIEARLDEAPVLLGNGNLIEEGRVEGTDRHYAIWHDPFPKPSYLFAIVGGRLDALRDRFTTIEGREVALAIYVEPGKAALATYAMDALKRAMRWDETAFGRAYDLDVFNVVAVSDFNMGAMENKGLNIFNEKYVLASPRTATDGDYAGIETVIAHEYFHNWTGNRITCRDWFQLSLKEGLTVFRDQEFSADQRSRAVKRIADVRALRSRQFPEDGGPLAHAVRPDSYREINNFYTATVYEKGAEVIRMYRTLLGAEAFARGLDLYFDRFDGQAVTVEDFMSCFEESAGRDLTQFFLWYTQAGTPELEMTQERDPAGRRLAVTLRQRTAPTPGQPDKAPFLIPIAFGLVSAETSMPVTLRTAAGAALSEAELGAGTIALATAERRIVFEDVPADATLSVLRDFSAPVRLKTNLSAEDLLTLAAHDSDAFNRWDAIQTLLMRRLMTRVGGGSAEIAEIEPALHALVARHDASDPAFVALALTLPSEGDMARELGRDVDPDALHAAREEVRTLIGRALFDRLVGLADDRAPEASDAIDAATAGRRALRNTALALVAAADADRGRALALRQFERCITMTDRLAALSTLCLLGGPTRDEALAQFYDAFSSEPLVLDKWFGLQASIPGPDTVERVRALMAHPQFSPTVPNRVYALIGGFAANPTAFNRRDGAGYELLAETVLALDSRNPQVAARMLNGFRSWRMMDAVRRRSASASMLRIVAHGTLSTDVADIIQRLLV